MNDEQNLLANAYFDGELTAEERRFAEADPEVMTEVEHLRALQFDLRDVAAPTPDAREAAIGAAMAAFGTATTAATATATAPAIPFRKRPAYARYLGVAAAIVAVAGLGIVISQSDLGGGDDDSSATDEPVAQIEALDEQFAEGTAESTFEDTADTAGDVIAESESGAGAAATAPADADIAADDGAEEAAEDMSDEAGGEDTPANVAAAERAIVPQDFDPDQPITDETDLWVYGSYLLDQRDRGALGPTPETECVGRFVILDSATYLRDDELIPVYVAVLEDDGLVVAIDRETCISLLVGSSR